MFKRKGSRSSLRKRNAKRYFCLRKLSEEALQIAMKRRKVKGKGKKERYPFECRVPKNSKEREESLPQ